MKKTGMLFTVVLLAVFMGSAAVEYLRKVNEVIK